MTDRPQASAASVDTISEFEDREVELRGWVYNKRSSGKLHFLQVRDGTGVIQCVVFKGDVSPEIFELCEELTQESAVVSDRHSAQGRALDHRF